MISLRSSDCRMVMCSSGFCRFPVRISVFGHMELLVHIICSMMITAVANATVSTWIANGGTTGDGGMRMDTSGLATYAAMVVVMTHLSTSARTRHAVPALRTVATSSTVIAIVAITV